MSTGPPQDGPVAADSVAGVRARFPFLLVAAAVVAAGLAARALLPTALGGPVGDALYATLVVVLVCVVRPRTSPGVALALGLGVCVAVELFQATGLPARAAATWPAARLVLGTTFAAADLPRYAVGAVVGAGLCALVRRTAPGRR